MMPTYNRGAVVLVNYPFITDAGVEQKVYPALVISDHDAPRRFPDDVMLATVTPQHVDDSMPNEFKVDSSDADFAGTGLKTTSWVRLDFVMTVPASLINRKIGSLTAAHIEAVGNA
jgi:mRNA interferase MazF